MIRTQWRRVGQWLLALLAPLGAIGCFLRHTLSAIGRFIGRLGLATRHILSWTIGETFYLLIKPPIVGFWRLLGRMGQVIRRLLTIFIGRPLAFFYRPIRWAYFKFIWPVWHWLAQLLHRALAWVAGHIRTFGRFIWRKTEIPRTLYGRRLKSRWIVWLARWRVFVKRPSPPSAP